MEAILRDVSLIAMEGRFAISISQIMAVQVSIQIPTSTRTWTIHRAEQGSVDQVDRYLEMTFLARSQNQFQDLTTSWYFDHE